MHYQTWYAEPIDPDDAFIYPGEVQLCETEGACATVKIDDGPVDLCSQSGWTVSGWNFVGRQATGPSNQCYWRLSNSLGILTRRKVNLTQMVRARLVFSYNLKWEYAGLDCKGEGQWCCHYNVPDVLLSVEFTEVCELTLQQRVSAVGCSDI